MSKESEEYRLRMLRHLEGKYGKSKPSEVLEAEKVIAKFREEEVRDRTAITRLGTPLPQPNLCPQCYYLHGISARLEAVPHPDPRNWDRMKCRTCGYTDDRPAR